MKSHRILLVVVLLTAPANYVRIACGQQAPGVEFAPTHEKQWEVKFDEDITPEEYARQLDYFSIEVAAISKNGRVDYISNLTQPKPVAHWGERAADPRLRIGWKSGTLHAADRRLLRKAGITSNDKELTHYFSPELQRQMERIELDYAHHDAREIELTRFQIRPREGDQRYEFVVIEQKPPKAAEKP
jgi:hypothetical protein